MISAVPAMSVAFLCNNPYKFPLFNAFFYNFSLIRLFSRQIDKGSGLICDGKLAGIFSIGDAKVNVPEWIRYSYFTNVYLHKPWIDEIKHMPRSIKYIQADPGQFRGIVWSFFFFRFGSLSLTTTS